MWPHISHFYFLYFFIVSAVQVRPKQKNTVLFLHSLVFTARCTLVQSAVLRSHNNSTINRVENCKYLGVIIDDQLKWSTHIEWVEQKLQRLIGILYKKIRYKLPNWCLRNIYFAFVYLNILYGLEVYGNTYVSYLDKLTTLNNKILRILQEKGRCCNDCLYRQHDTPSMPAL